MAPRSGEVLCQARRRRLRDAGLRAGQLGQSHLCRGDLRHRRFKLTLSGTGEYRLSGSPGPTPTRPDVGSTPARWRTAAAFSFSPGLAGCSRPGVTLTVSPRMRLINLQNGGFGGTAARRYRRLPGVLGLPQVSATSRGSSPGGLFAQWPRRRGRPRRQQHLFRGNNHP